jgi:excisionase family DNA binding protein
MRAEHRIRHELINGEELVFSQPEDSVIEYLERIRHAMENPTVSEQKMLELIYHPDNPLMDPEIIPGRGMVTTRTLEHPAYRVMMDYLDRKRVESGTLDLAGTEAAYSLNVTDAANLLDIHPSAIRQAIQSGRLTAWKKGRTHREL